jgi:hypothetical protein
MYKYRGTIHDLDEPLTMDLPPEEYESCGTMTGYRRHLRNGQEACPDCKDAKRVQSRKEYALYRDKKPNPKVVHTDVCGTDAGYRRHQYHNTTPCRPCKEAHNEYHRNRRARMKANA